MLIVKSLSVTRTSDFADSLFSVTIMLSGVSSTVQLTNVDVHCLVMSLYLVFAVIAWVKNFAIKKCVN